MAASIASILLPRSLTSCSNLAKRLLSVASAGLFVIAWVIRSNALAISDAANSGWQTIQFNQPGGPIELIDGYLP
ncbi:hypothetical protein V1505DRAFT_381890 [Lipomyces doorenjongii]